MTGWLRWLMLPVAVTVLVGASSPAIAQHPATIAERVGESVTRGQRLGALGTSGQRAMPGYEHVHLELQRGADPRDLHDPLPRMVGCFDASARYPVDRLALTYPVPC